MSVKAALGDEQARGCAVVGSVMVSTIGLVVGSVNGTPGAADGPVVRFVSGLSAANPQYGPSAAGGRHVDTSAEGATASTRSVSRSGWVLVFDQRGAAARLRRLDNRAGLGASNGLVPVEAAIPAVGHSLRARRASARALPYFG